MQGMYGKSLCDSQCILCHSQSQSCNRDRLMVILCCDIFLRLAIAQAAGVDAFLLRLAAVEEDEERQQDRRDRRQQHGQQLVPVLHAADLAPPARARSA